MHPAQCMKRGEEGGRLWRLPRSLARRGGSGAGPPRGGAGAAEQLKSPCCLAANGRRACPPAANGSAGAGSGVTLAAAAMAPERGGRSLPAGTEGLPRVFLQSLRTLFDILDDRRRGYVHLREIESRWRGAEAQELPAGVMEGLRQAAPASGFLTFERFVLGLRAALPGAETPVEGGSGGQRSVEKPPSPRCSEQRRGKSAGQREPGHCQPRGRGEWRDLDWGLRARGGDGSAGAGDCPSEVGMGSRGSPRSPVPSGFRASSCAGPM